MSVAPPAVAYVAGCSATVMATTLSSPWPAGSAQTTLVCVQPLVIGRQAEPPMVRLLAVTPAPKLSPRTVTEKAALPAPPTRPLVGPAAGEEVIEAKDGALNSMLTGVLDWAGEPTLTTSVE